MNRSEWIQAKSCCFLFDTLLTCRHVQLSSWFVSRMHSFKTRRGHWLRDWEFLSLTDEFRV